MKHRTDATAESAEQLVENLRSLISEAQKTLGESITDQTEGRLGELRERISDAQEKLKDIYGDARKKVVSGAKQADQTIRAHPYESLAIALGVGVLLGALIRRNN